jgi:ATP/maltotriose-dependent transcriptional regulator MalT
MIASMASRIASPELIGREVELEAISAAFEQTRAGQGRTVLIGGEAGVGKSRLLAAALDRARAEGAVVLMGGCVGLAEGALPFAPIVEAIRPLLAEVPRPPVAGATMPADPSGPWSADLRGEQQLLPGKRGSATVDDALIGVAAELGLLTRQRAADAAAELHPEWARVQLYEAFLGLLRRLAVNAPVVLAIEDLHWGGDSTRELLAFLVRNARTERLLLLVTFRSDELHRRHPLLLWLGEANRSPGLERLELARLERPALARQLSGILGRRPDPDLLESIFVRSEGNPFFAEELVAAGVETGPLPPTLREVLAARLAHVSEPTLGVLGVAAVVGRRVDHDLLARVSELSDRDLDEALGEALSAQLLVADEEAPSERYAFRHALLAEAAADTVLPGRRRRLHAAIAQVLAESNGLQGAERAGHLIEIAHHWFEARELDKAFTSSLQAGDAAQAAGAFAEALRQYERAAELWDIVPGSAAEAKIDRLELLRRAAHSAQISGEYPRAISLLREAADLARARQDPILEGLLYERLGRSLWTSGDFAGAEEAYRRAIDLVPEEPPSADRARVLAGYGQVLMLAGHYSESFAIGKRALELARATSSRQLEGHALCTIGSDLAYMGRADEGAVLTREAITIAEEVGDFDDIGRGYACHASVLEVGDRREESVAVSLEGARRMRELSMVATYGAFVAMNAADGMIGLGRWDEALELARELHPTARGTSRLYSTGILARLLTMRGDFDEARLASAELSQLLGAGVEAQFNGPIAAIQIDLAALTADTAAGRRVADRAIPILAQTEHVGLHALVLAAAIRLEADTAERARAARDDEALAEATGRANLHLAEIRGLADGLAPGPIFAEVEKMVAFAEAEATRIASIADPTAWRRPRDMALVRGPAYDAVYGSYRLAEALLADRESRDEAASLLAEAHRGASRLGARPLREAIEALATRARVPFAATMAVEGPEPATPSERGGASSPERGAAAYGLSEREIEVLRLLGAGRTNRQIGRELFISESTAGVHVSHILAKLGVAGRVEAATIAAHLGLI